MVGMFWGGAKVKWLKYVQEDKSQWFVFSGIQCQMLKDQKNRRRQMQYSYRANGEKKEGGWRMDVDITVQDKFDKENDAEDMILSENKDESGSESDHKSCTPDTI